MAMNDLSLIPLGEIVAKYVDLEPMNNAIIIRIAALSPLLGPNNPKGAAELEKELSMIVWQAEGEDRQIKYCLTTKKSLPFVDDLEDGTKAVAGGDGGIAHNPDGTTYRSKVKPEFWGNELESLSIDAINIKEDIEHVGQLMAPDATLNAVSAAKQEIKEEVKPIFSDAIGGVLRAGMG